MADFILSEWTSSEYRLLNERLDGLADGKYREFSERLIETRLPMRGVRLPELKKLAREIAKGNWRSYLARVGRDSYEEVMLNGLVIGLAKGDVEETLGYVRQFIPAIDNWGINDSFTGALKIAGRNLTRVWDFLQDYFYAAGEFEVRFSVTMLLGYYILPEYIERVLYVLHSISHQGYYVKMAVAWALSVCYVKFPAQTMELFQHNHLDDFTYNKALQKIVESYRVPAPEKETIRNMKRK